MALISLCFYVNDGVNTMLLRTLIILGCYLLSSYGIIVSVILANAGLMLVIVNLSHFRATLAGLSFIAFCLLILHAWMAHGVMSIAWIRHRKVNRRWVVSGTLAGVISLAFIPVSAIFEDVNRGFVLQNGIYSTDIYDILLSGGKSAFVPLIFVFPSVLLAIYLVRFHWRKSRSLVGCAPRTINGC